MAQGAPIKYGDIANKGDIEQLQKDLQSLSTAMKSLRTELGEVQKVMSKNPLKSGNDLKNYNDSVTKSVAVTNDIMNVQERAIKTNSSYFSSIQALDKQKQKEIATNQKAAAALAKQEGYYNKLSLALVANRQKFRQLSEEELKNKNIGGQLIKTIQKQDKELKKLDNSIGNNQRSVGKYTDALKGLGSQLMGALGITAGITMLVSAFKNMINVSMEFEKSLSSLSAITGATGKDLEFYKNAALETAKVTLQGASDIVKAYELIGSKSPELLKNKEALAEVTKQAIILSEATGGKLGLVESAAAVTTTMNQLGMEGSEAARIINVLAAASQAGSADVSYLASANEKAGTTARLMGLNVEQLTGAIESIAPFYSEAGMAGNSFDKVLLKLKEKQIGYTDGVFDMNDALNELRIRYKNGETAAQIFGVEHSKMGELLVLNQAKFNEYTAAITGTTKATDQQTIQNDNLAGALTKLSNNWETFILGLNNSSGSLKKTIDLVSSLINAAGGLGTTWGITWYGRYWTAAKKTEEDITALTKDETEKRVKELEAQKNEYNRQIKEIMDFQTSANDGIALSWDELMKTKDAAQLKHLDKLIGSIDREKELLNSLEAPTSNPITPITPEGNVDEQKINNLKSLKEQLTELKTARDLLNVSDTAALTASALEIESLTLKIAQYEKLGQAIYNQDLYNQVLQESNQELTDSVNEMIDKEIQDAYDSMDLDSEVTDTKVALSKIRIDQIKAEQEAHSEAQKAEAEAQGKTLENTADLFSSISGMLEQGSEESKAFAIASTIIDTYRTISSIIAGFSELGPWGIAAGAIAAAAAAVQGFARVDAIANTPVPKARSYFQGTEYLELNGNPKGKDTIPIYAHEGERIVPSDINRALAGVSNIELPSLVNSGKVAQDKYGYMMVTQQRQTNSLLRKHRYINARGQEVDIEGNVIALAK